MSDRGSSQLVIQLLGPFHALREGQPLPRLRVRKGHWLLTLLILRHPRPVERAWLAATLWPDLPEAQALASLRSSLTQLRIALGPDAGRLRSPTPQTLALDLAGVTVNLLAFDEAITAGDPLSLERAVALYRGLLLEGCAEEWVLEERQLREQAYLGALERLAIAAQSAGDRDAMTRYLRQAAAADPLQESTQRALMQSLADQGSYAAALSVYRELRERLHRELNAGPDPETNALFQQIRAEARTRAQSAPTQPAVPLPALGSSDVARPLQPKLPGGSPPLRSLDRLAHNLPAQLTSFVGREREMAQVRQCLATTRLLTLTGSGGCGKTRLALQVAADLLEEYPQGVWLVDLAPLDDPALVPQRAAATLGVHAETGRPLTETLVDYLRRKALLLVLDNCEHLLADCAALADHLLRACPKLRILASSRAGLGIGGERTYRVPSLSYPDPRRLRPVERLMEYEAVRLFVERAVFTQPCFAVTEQSAPAVAQVCARLDGIPLAIELAAARVKALPVEKLNERLDDMFRLLTGGSRAALPRHQTLRALIDWSYDLLSPSEQALLRHLSVFAGGWTLEAAEAVGAGEGVEAREVLDLLTSLVDKSLVLYEEPGTHAAGYPRSGWRCGEARYRLLETVRQYAGDRLLEAGNATAAHDRHRDWFVVLAERAKPHLQQGAEQRTWMERLARERDNLRAALAWCQEAVDSDQGRVAGLRLVGALTWFWICRGHQTEEWQRVLSLLAAGHGAPADVRGKALVCAMSIASYEDDWPTAAALAAEGLALGREAGDNWLAAASLDIMGAVAQHEGDLERAQAIGEEGLALAWAAGEEWIVSALLERLAAVAVDRGDDAVARALYQEILDRFRQAEDTGGIAEGLQGLAGVAQREGNYEQASALLEEAIALTQGVGRPKHSLYLLMRLADWVLIEGDYELAKARYHEALAIAQEIGDTYWRPRALLGLARAAQALGDHDQARTLLEEAHTVGQGWDTCMGEGDVLLELGDYTAARSCYEEGLMLRRARERNVSLIGAALLQVGHAAWLQGEPVVTQSHALEALALFQTVGDEEGKLVALDSLAVAALAQGGKERAARLLGAAEARREALGLAGPRTGRLEWQRPRERIGEAVGAVSLKEAFATAWAEGRAMSLEDAVAYALEPGGAAPGEGE